MGPLEMTPRSWQPGDGTEYVLGGGDRAVFKITANDSQGRFSFLEFVSQPGHPGSPAHIHHGHEELWYILEGTLSMLVGEEVFLATPGSTHFVPRGVAHAFRNDGEQPCKFVAVFSPGGLERHMQERSQLLATTTPTQEMLEALAHKHDLTIVSVPAHSPWNHKLT